MVSKREVTATFREVLQQRLAEQREDALRAATRVAKQRISAADARTLESAKREKRLAATLADAKQREVALTKQLRDTEHNLDTCEQEVMRLHEALDAKKQKPQKLLQLQLQPARKHQRKAARANAAAHDPAPANLFAYLHATLSNARDAWFHEPRNPTPRSRMGAVSLALDLPPPLGPTSFRVTGGAYDPSRKGVQAWTFYFESTYTHKVLRRPAEHRAILNAAFADASEAEQQQWDAWAPPQARPVFVYDPDAQLLGVSPGRPGKKWADGDDANAAAFEKKTRLAMREADENGSISGDL